MTIVVDVRPEVQAEIARQAALQGCAIEAHAAALLEEAIQLPPAANQPVFDLERAQAAGARIREIGNALTLGGLNIRALIEEGRA